jgi:hypothetical protein
MLYNNLAVLEAIELLLAGIVVLFATIWWKTRICLLKVVQRTTLAWISERIFKHICGRGRWEYLLRLLAEIF